MLSRRFALAAIVFLVPLVPAAGQETTDLQPLANWAAPPFWSAPAKPAGDKEASGALETEAVDVVPSPPMPFVATNPCRIADTRGLGFSGQAGPPALSVGVTRVFQITGTVAGVPAQCGIPTTAQAVSFQFSATGMNSAGNLIAWPEGAPPTTSVLNWNASSVAIGNGIVVPLGASGSVSVQLNGNAGAITHLIIDVNGYYAPVGIVNTLNGLSGAVTLAAGANISITPAGQNLTIANTTPAAWSLTGNGATSPGTNFLGTTDNQPLEIKVNNQRAMRFESQVTPNVIGGAGTNTVTAGVYGATIGGGGFFANSVTDSSSTVAGGSGNRAGNASGDTGDALAATVGGGRFNIAGGTFATVPGGESNEAAGAYSFAAGRRAKATGQGTFVWADSTDADFLYPITNSFAVRANGGTLFQSNYGSLTVSNSGASTSASAALVVSRDDSASTGSVVMATKHSSSGADFFRCVDTFLFAQKCHIDATGAFVAGMDFAEALPAKGGKRGFEPGDVLVMSRDSAGSVERSSTRYDTRAIGILSTRPGFLGADKNGETRVDPDDVPVAITGIVPTKVTAENGPIQPGDLLTTSSTPGHAMKAKPASVAGVEVYPTGTILGKALESLAGERGVIRVLVMAR